MFVVDHVLVSDDLLDARFTCNLGACHGACCVQGDSGAPLEPEERSELEAVLPRVRHKLRPEALAVIKRQGVWEETNEGEFATTCVNNRECVFVVYEGPVAKCAIQKAYHAGRVSFEKPVSCHLFPIRVENYGEYDVLNYEQIDLCQPGRQYGCKTTLQLADYLREPLERKYGATWYQHFQASRRARREALDYPPE